MLDVQFGQASDFGKVRTNNEDAMGSFLPASRHQARSHGFLFAVADGVGGMDLGQVASATAVKVVTEEFAKAQAGTMLLGQVPRLIQHANARVQSCTAALACWMRRGTSPGSMVPAWALANSSVTTLTAVAEATSPRSMPPTPSATAKRKPCERAWWREAGMNDPIASSLLVRTLPKSLAWPNCTSNMGAIASIFSVDFRSKCSHLNK